MADPVKVRAIHKVTWLTQDCPCCNADWRGAEIEECERDAWGGLSHYSTVYWRRGAPDTVIIFECPKCAVEFVTNEGERGTRRRRVGVPVARGADPVAIDPKALGVNTSPSPETLARIDEIERVAAETMRAIQLDKTVFR